MSAVGEDLKLSLKSFRQAERRTYEYWRSCFLRTQCETTHSVLQVWGGCRGFRSWSLRLRTPLYSWPHRGRAYGPRCHSVRCSRVRQPSPSLRHSRDGPGRSVPWDLPPGVEHGIAARKDPVKQCNAKPVPGRAPNSSPAVSRTAHIVDEELEEALESFRQAEGVTA